MDNSMEIAINIFEKIDAVVSGKRKIVITKKISKASRRSYILTRNSHEPS